jgi:hypothetical protein
MESGSAPKRLVLRFGGSLVEQLGAQLYPRVTASVAELVSNAWDADARHVWITIPFDADWNSDATIEVLDDGNGMTREQAARQYLVVGRNRRLEGGDTSEKGRPLHGRKGIGKLAAFGTAGYLECVTVRDGETTAFGIDYDKLRAHKPTEDYPVEPVENIEPLANPRTGKPLPHGTRVRLTRLKAKRKTGEESFRRSMARRFALDAAKMSVAINGEALTRYEVDVEVLFPRDAKPPRPEVSIGRDGWAADSIPYPTKAEPDARREVRWWIGFTPTPIPDEDMRGISVLARGKLAQRPFMFERALGTTGQLGQEYLVGEVAADWLDSGVVADEDLIQSNRDQLQLDNEELEPFMKWGRELLTWALAQRNSVRREKKVGPGALGKQVEAVLEAVPASSRERMRTLAGRIADVTQADQAAVAQAVRAVVDATEAKATERLAADLALEGDPDDENTWKLLDEARETVRAGSKMLHVARRDALGNFAVAIAEPPVGRLHHEIPSSPWIISPLLANLPFKVLWSDGDGVSVTFGPLAPILKGINIVCWAVGTNSPSLPAGVDEPDLQVASSWRKKASHLLTWEQVLRQSGEAHEVIIDVLEEQP